jgi:hypothetical protein
VINKKTGTNMNPALKLAHEKFTCQKYYPFNATNPLMSHWLI